MNTEYTVFHYVSLTLEATTPHGIQSGQGDLTHDVLLVRDSNGLPALPATSLAGVLRHLYQQQYDDNATDALFGSIRDEARGVSAVQFSWGLIHDQHNQPVEGLRPDIHADPLLAALHNEKPIVRQRVRLDARGGATDTGKFDITLVPAGARYSCFISAWSDGSEAQDSAIDNLLQMLNSPLFRLGHGTRSGLGAFRVQRLHRARWDLTTEAGRTAFQQRPRKRQDFNTLQAVTLPEVENSLLRCELTLQAEAGWRVGGGAHALCPPDQSGRFADLLPQSEPRIIWPEGQTAQLTEPQPVLPASALKGALAHRTAYHWRCLEGRWADSPLAESVSALPEPLQALFGNASDNRDIAESGEQGGRAGRLIIDDLYLDDPVACTQMHNRIDHFTGGVIHGALFKEELLWQTPLSLNIQIQDACSLPASTLKALARSLEDLASGWLPLGAGGARGHGVFTGSLTWHNTDTLDMEEIV